MLYLVYTTLKFFNNYILILKHRMEDKDKIYYFTLIPRSYADKSKTV